MSAFRVNKLVHKLHNSASH